jgi:hypothetical protein
VTYPALASFTEAQLAAPSRRDLLEKIAAAVENGPCVAVVICDPDQAKTDFLSQLTARLAQGQRVLRVSKQAQGDCYRQLAAQLSLADQADDADLAASVSKALSSESTSHVTVLCEDADEYDSETLEQLRQISNLIPAGGKHLNLVFCGSDHLLKRFRTAALQSLGQRVTQWFRVEPLTPSDVALYLETVQQQAGGALSKVTFYPTFIRELQRLSQGKLDILNRLTDSALARTEITGQTNPGMDDVRRANYYLGYATLSGTTLGWGALAAVALIATSIGSYCLGMNTGTAISANARNKVVSTPSYVTFQMDDDLKSKAK